MDNNNQINVQDIMKEIKKDIEVKGYTNDLLSFDDVIVAVGIRSDHGVRAAGCSRKTSVVRHNGTVPSLLWCEEPGGTAGTEPGAGGGIQTAGGAGSTAHIKHIIE